MHATDSQYLELHLGLWHSTRITANLNVFIDRRWLVVVDCGTGRLPARSPAPR